MGNFITEDWLRSATRWPGTLKSTCRAMPG